VLRHVRLEAVLEAEHPQRPLAVPHQRVERREQRHAVPAAPPGLGQRRRISPGPETPGGRSGWLAALGPGAARGAAPGVAPGPARGSVPGDGDRRQPGGQRGLGHQPRVLALFAGQVVEPVIVDQVGRSDHAERPGGDPGQVRDALEVGRLGAQQSIRQDPLGQVIDPAPARPPDADDLAGVEQPLHRDLDVGPVPPRPAALGPAQLGRGQRALGPQPGQDLLTGFLVALVPPHPPGPEGAAPEREVGPLLERQHAGRVRPVLEGGRRTGVPVRLLDLLPRNRPQPRVGDQLVRPREHADRVELHGTDPAQHRRDPVDPADPLDPAVPLDPVDPAVPLDLAVPLDPVDPVDLAVPPDPALPMDPVPARGAQQPLRAQGDPAGLVRGDRQLSHGSIQAHPQSLTVGYDISGLARPLGVRQPGFPGAAPRNRRAPRGIQRA
jgi:hypothetical protein